MGKVAITADWHWGVPGRLHDIHWAARVTRDYCRRQNIDTILVLGDLLHDRSAVELDVWNTLYDFLSETKRLGQEWIAFPGNHDMFLKHSWGVNSLRPLRDQMTVIEDVRLLTLDERRFYILPFIHLETSYMRVLHKLEQLYQEGDTLLTHIGVRGATLNTCFLLKDWSCVTFDDSPFRRIYTGHFHSRQNLNDQVYYPGSPIPFKFDEGDVPHGFYVLDLDTMQHEFVDIWKEGRTLFPDETPPPQYYTILQEQLHDIEPEIVRHNMIRVAHERDLPQEERDQIKNSLADLGGVAVRWLPLRQDAPAEADQDGAVATNPAAAVMNHDDLFEWWMEQDDSGTAELDKSLLRKLRAELKQEGDERYVYSEPD